MTRLTVLVCGATGRFSGLNELLINRGHRVLAGTRSPDSPAARQLRDHGAQIVRLDFDDPSSISRAARHADAVVAAGTTHAAGPAADIRHGRAVVDAAAAARVDRLVYITVAGADRRTGVPLIDSKYEVEHYLRRSGVPHTIVAPVYLMENMWNPWNAAALTAGRLPTPVSRFRPLQQIPISDVLELTAHILQSHNTGRGERIEIASDELTAERAAEIITRLLGRHVNVEDPPADQPNPLFIWLERVGTQVDIAALRQRFPDIGWHTFAEWATEQNWRLYLGRSADRS
jgi:uncharacterized protein YbjT (DUF2867 family)